MNLRLTKRLRLLTFALLFFSSLTAFAVPRVTIAPAPDWCLPAKPGGRAPTSREFTEGYYTALVDLQTHVERQQRYTHIIREIKTTQGVQNGSQISVYVDPAHEQLTFHAVTIYRAGTAIRQQLTGAFKVAPVEAERDRFIYGDSYVATLLLEDVRPGDRIEYDFTLTGFNPVLGSRYADDFYFSSSDLLPHYHRVLVVSPTRKLTFRNENNPPAVHTSEQNGLKIYEWDAYTVKTPASEPSEPDWNDTTPRVQVSEYGTWQEVVNWAAPMYAVPPPSGPLLPLVADWKKLAVGNPQRYLELAVLFVQNDVRYMGIELGENSHRPHDPVQVLRQRYGDCKDKALLLCTLLQANQIPAYPALTNTYSRRQVAKQLPGPHAFNHAIVRLSLNGKTAWIDPTLSHQRPTGGEFSIPPYGMALVLRPGETSLQPVTSPSRGRVSVVETFVVPAPATPDATGTLQVVSTYSANHADAMRSELAESSLSSLEEAYLSFYQGAYKEWTVDQRDTLTIDDDPAANVMTAREAYTITNGWQTDSLSGKATFSVWAKTMYDNLLTLPAQQRKQPLRLPFPYDVTYTIHLQLPEAWPTTADEWRVTRAGYELSFARSSADDGRSIQLTYHYKTLADHLPADAVATYRADVTKLMEQLEYQLTYDGEVVGQAGNKQAGSIIFYVLAAVGLFYLSRWLYRYSPQSADPFAVAPPLGGWLLLLALGVFSAPFVFIVAFLDTSAYTDASTWTALTNATDVNAALLPCVIYAEGVINLALFWASLICAVLFVQRRTTFPRVYSLFLVGRLVFTAADAVVASELAGTALSNDVATNIGRAIITAAIWLPYLHRSTRVRRTFVRTWPSVSPTEDVTPINSGPALDKAAPEPDSLSTE